MSSVMTSEFVKTSHNIEAPPFSLIEQKSLAARLVEEISRTASEITRDPRGFIRDLLADDTRDKKRQRRMRVLLASALAFHLVLLGVIVVAGWHFIKNESETELKVDEWIKPVKSGNSANTPDAPKSEKSGDGKSGNGSPGGGGQNDPRPVNQGVPPQSVPGMVAAKFSPPNTPPPLLEIPQTIQGPQSAAPAPDAPIGLPNGEAGVPPSPGPGNGGGIGPGDGPGAGNNTGPGVGRNQPGPGGPGNGNPNGGPGNGIKGPYDWNRLKAEPGSRDVQIVYKVRAIPTPEAQEHKVSGEVVFRLTVNSDGSISDVDVVSTVPYMTEAAEVALRKCRFLPATIKGVPVTVRNVIVRIKVGLEERR